LSKSIFDLNASACSARSTLADVHETQAAHHAFVYICKEAFEAVLQGLLSPFLVVSGPPRSLTGTHVKLTGSHCASDKARECPVEFALKSAAAGSEHMQLLLLVAGMQCKPWQPSHCVDKLPYT
jgi:hypothetical protein